MYGITETTVHVTYRPISAMDVASGHGSPIGRPLPDLSAYILDQHLNPVPIGVPGQLYVGGAGVARGYLKRPELTAERFIRNPFSIEPGARLYQTGDLVRYLPDGSMDYLGRVDHQVKIRGFRIELGEVEAVLGRHPAVAQVAAVVAPAATGERRLLAYVVLRAAATAGELRRYLQEQLPAYMVPAAIVALPAFPLTPNGKLDLAALPPPDAVGREEGEIYEPPRSATETTIASVWREVLGVEKVGLTDNFFDLGGHSLLVVRVQQRLRDSLGLQVPIVELFRHPTVGALAGYATRQGEQLSLQKVGDRVAARREARAHQRRSRQQRTGRG
jgi:hypothetical protein